MVTNTANMKQTAAKKHVRKIAPFTVVSAVILIILCLSLIIPFIWGLITAFKTPLEYVGDKLGFPTDWTLANFAEAFKNFTVKVPSGTGSVTYNVWGMLLWSAIYAVGGAIIQAMSCALVAYAVARFNKFKISKVLYSIVIITMILPIVGAMPSELRILRALGIYNTIFGMLILKANFLGAYFLMFHAFFSHIPKDYYEAAAIDGAGNFTILFRMVFPMVKTLFWTIVLLYFLGNWNDYNITLIYAPSYPTLAYGLYSFNMSNNPEIADTPHKMAGAMMLFIPIFLFFCIFQKKLIGENLSEGGIKG